MKNEHPLEPITQQVRCLDCVLDEFGICADHRAAAEADMARMEAIRLLRSQGFRVTDGHGREVEA